MGQHRDSSDRGRRRVLARDRSSPHQPDVGHRQQSCRLSFGANYRDHLADPKEIAADMVRVLAGYPKPTAERLFGGPDPEALSHDADLLVARARPHVRAVMGFDFQSHCSPRENFIIWAE